MGQHFSHDVERILARCEGAYAPGTLRSYRHDLAQYQAWCANRGLSWLPADPDAIAAFLDEQAKTKTLSTIKRRFEAICFAHNLCDLPSPRQFSAVRLALRRVRRAKPRRPAQALGLTAGLLEKVVAACPGTLAGLRDAALLSVGYDALARSSEICAMRIEHLRADGQSLIVPRSKSDPFGDGRIAWLSQPSRTRLNAWLEASGLISGPLFRGLHTGKASPAGLDTSSIRRLIKVAAKRAELAPDTIAGLSGHSMRVGGAQDMMVAGIDVMGIMQAGGWKSQEVLARYVENASAAQMHKRRWQKLGLLMA
jgi:integrase/recombinase XerD